MPEPKLSIVPCGDYTPETVRAALLAALDAVGGLDWVKPGMRIGIKLNLCAARKPEQAAFTSRTGISSRRPRSLCRLQATPGDV